MPELGFLCKFFMIFKPIFCTGKYFLPCFEEVILTPFSPFVYIAQFQMHFFYVLSITFFASFFSIFWLLSPFFMIISFFYLIRLQFTFLCKSNSWKVKKITAAAPETHQRQPPIQGENRHFHQTIMYFTPAGNLISSGSAEQSIPFSFAVSFMLERYLFATSQRLSSLEG